MRIGDENQDIYAFIKSVLIVANLMIRYLYRPRRGLYRYLYDGMHDHYSHTRDTLLITQAPVRGLGDHTGGHAHSTRCKMRMGDKMSSFNNSQK